ncbi:MAG: AfsR/SARP family transcriptional regulator [Actinobacteria bacterium]|nr:MAG: AfsR/SARP family transcriptional regulator [Actinomycetota bacterium]
MAWLLEFRLLGPVEAVIDGRPVRLPAAKPRALLAVLLLDRNRVVSVGRLVEDLWGDDPPETATKALQGYVSQLRKALGADRLLTKPPGYSLRVEDGELDLDRFEGLLREGRELLGAGDSKAAARRLAEALELWRGAPFAEFESEPFARDAGARLEDARLAVLEERIEADLALGRHTRLIPELEELVGNEPLRERPRAQLMLALYRSGRQAAALELYRRTRETLSDELGIEPSLELQELERRMLQHDPTLERARAPARQAEDGAPVPLARRPQFLVLAALVLAVIAAVIAAVALTSGGSSGKGASGSGELRSFVDKLENFLGQSHDGRVAVAAAVSGAFNCKLTPQAALARLDRVQRNRQSLLQQAAALSVPSTEEALSASDLLQKSVHASFTADGHYSDWLSARNRCGPPDNSSDLKAARAADKTATRTKRMFVAAFNPLASRFHRRTWVVGDF